MGVAVVLGALIIAPPAAAQETSLITLRPADPDRWDFATQVGWFGGNKSDIAPDWNNWYDAASFDVSGGYYWSPHLKFEVGVSTTAQGTLFVQQQVEVFPGALPYFRSQEHRFRATSVGAGLIYQFFQNSWFHPFVGGGVAVVHEAERAQVSQPTVFFRDAQTRVVVPPTPPIDRESTSARPFASLGFKAYVSPRAFIRTDLRVAASRERAESVEWRAGVGFDF
jgi:hypothetical protein